MSLEVAALRESFIAFVALIGSFTCVSSHMDFKSTGSHELVATHVTDVWSFSRVSSLVISEMSLSSEAHVTISEVAFKRLLSIVNSHMSE